MMIITQGYGAPTPVTGTVSGTIPEYSSTGDTYIISVDTTLTPVASIVFDQEITGLDKSTAQQ